MLLEFSCSNHKSIRDEVLFSFLAGKDTLYEDSLYHFGGLNILRIAYIYGANGTGKSNFIDAISFVKSMVVQSVNHKPDVGVRQIPHKLETVERESVYNTKFIKNGIMYDYSFSLKNFYISNESLYYYPKGRKVIIFERSSAFGNSVKPGAKFKGKFGFCKDVLKPNKLLLSCAASFSAVNEVLEAYRFFSDDLVIYLGGRNAVKDMITRTSPEFPWLVHSFEQFAGNKDVKEEFIDCLHQLGIPIKDFSVEFEKVQEEISESNQGSLNTPIKLPYALKVSIKPPRVSYNIFETDLFLEESNGIQMLFIFLSPFLEVIKKGRVLVCDELEASLHEVIIFNLLKRLYEVNGEGRPQLLMATHNSTLLTRRPLRKDQVWFTELRQKDRSTDLYSLAELKNVSGEENFARGYISGKYGAIPVLSKITR